MSTMIATLEDGTIFSIKGFKGVGNKGILAIAEDAANLTLSALWKLEGLTTTPPGDDSHSFLFPVELNIREFRFRAIKTAGGTTGAVLRYVLDAPDWESEAIAFAFLRADENQQSLPTFELFDGEWSEWVPIGKDEEFLLPLQRVGFLPTADTWTILMEVA